MTQTDIAISAQSLGKSYKIGHRSKGGRSETLRDAMVKGVSNFARKTGDVLRGRPLIAGDTIEEFWALKDVSFEVKRGEAVGIIGHNGAGKSTLLKVLSRITEPTAGQVRIAGRIASLLEVGTGFHPELSGRENVYLNGAVLGMTRAEINRKFDEIVDFAGVEKFLDTPVKRYSSGMYVRLAFSVAAHLEPEILVVDEVLAVGDTAFQQKCLGKMQDVAGQGRTVLFVSHNLAAIKALCSKALLLSRGQIVANDDVSSVIAVYNSNMMTSDSPSVYRNPQGAIRQARILQSNEVASTPLSTLPIILEIEIDEAKSNETSLELVLCDTFGNPVAFWPGALIDGSFLSSSKKQKISINLKDYAAGKYSLDILLTRPGERVIENIPAALHFELHRGLEKSGWRFNAGRGQGAVLLNATKEDVREP